MSPEASIIKKAKFLGTDKFKVNNRQKKKFAKQGITFEGSGKDQKMIWRGIEIYPDARNAPPGAAIYDQIYEANSQFRSDVSASDATWRSSVGAWFSSHTMAFLKRIGNAIRNKFRKHDESKSTAEADAKKVLNGDLSDSFGAKTQQAEIDGMDDYEGGSSSDLAYDPDNNNMSYTNTDADGNQTTYSVKNEAQGKNSLTHTTGGDTYRFKTDKDGKYQLVSVEQTKSMTQKITEKISMVGDISCMITRVIGTISAAVTAFQVVEVINLASSFLEISDKAKAGEGNASPINEMGSMLTKPASSEYEKTNSLTEVNTNEYEADTETITKTGSAMQSLGTQALYSGNTVNGSDPEIQQFVPTNAMSNALNGGVIGKVGSLISSATLSASAFRACTEVRIATASIGIVFSTLELISCFVPILDIFTCPLSPVSIDKIKKVVKGVAIAALKAAAIALGVAIAVIVVPKILNANYRVGDFAGLDLGNAIVSGSSRFMGRNHLHSGGSVASRDSYLAFRLAENDVIAENARRERETKSPFDPTSKYTFMGSLMTKMATLPTATGGKTLSFVSNLGSTALKSFSSLLPGASAAEVGNEVAEKVEYTEENCKDLNEIGGIGDSFCEPYYISDMSTIDEDPAAIVQKVEELGNNNNNNIGSPRNFVEKDYADDELPEIEDNSALAKYIIYCGERESSFGQVDYNIAGNLEISTDPNSGAIVPSPTGSIAGTVAGTVGDIGLGLIPFVGDTLDLVSSTNILDNFDFVSGKACVTGSEKTKNEDNDAETKNADWEENKYYQRFVQDQLQAEIEGDIEKSAVTAYLEKYHEEHPLDNSFEGLLARYSGRTKDDIELALNVIDLADFIANYKPAKLLPTPRENDEEKRYLVESDFNYIVNYEIALFGQDEYIDKRKNFLI